MVRVPWNKGKPISDDIDLKRLADMTEGFSGADVSSVANTAASLVLHDYIQKYPSPEDALKHTSEARISIRHFENAVKNVRRLKLLKSFFELPFHPISHLIKALNTSSKPDLP